ncbi:MAG: hypothetical protein Q4B54_14825 [Coriobacteriales bacterium]|nr:hypothetical protein [Coriobacteriales bacterium]
MKETDALVRVQEIDLALMRHARTLSAMPQTKKAQTILAARKKLASQLSKVVGQRKDAEMDLQENEASYMRLNEVADEIQAKFDSGTAGYRELADLESQLTSLAKRIEKREFNHKDLEARLSKIKATENDLREMDARLVSEGEAQLRSYKEQTADIQHDVSRLNREREEVVQSIQSDTLERYQAAVKRFGGLAVETLKANMPSVCRVTIPPSSIGDVRRGPAITECPYCHRLLVTDRMYDFDENK